MFTIVYEQTHFAVEQLLKIYYIQNTCITTCSLVLVLSLCYSFLPERKEDHSNKGQR